MLRTKIAVLVSGGGTNLQALIDAEREGIIKSGKLSLVISNKADAYALERAKRAGIDTLIIEKKRIRRLISCVKHARGIFRSLSMPMPTVMSISIAITLWRQKF